MEEINMEIEAKLTALHVVAGLIAGVVSFLLSSGFISAIGKNDFMSILLSLAILYITGQISERIFGKEAVGGLKGWLFSGILPFFFIWVIIWTLLLNW
jgi:hypothetical protein